MKTKVSHYTGKNLNVSYDVKRCIHAEACVHGLPRVFNPRKRPWIEPDQADPDALATVIMQCPTGALHFERTDGGPSESIPSENTVRISPDGPLYLHGDIMLEKPDGTTVLEDMRMALCRCGLSKNKPLCDGSHTEGFYEPGALGEKKLPTADTEDDQSTLRVVVSEDGPYLLQGPFAVKGLHDETRTGVKTALCRCGASKNKPFCDGSHKKVGFSGA